MNLKYTAIALAAAVTYSTLTGCIRDDYEECPVLSVHFGLKDKVYDNASSVSFTDPNASASLTDIIPTVNCVLKNDKGQIVRQFEYNSSNINNLLKGTDFDQDLPFGHYTLIAWGAVKDDSQLTKDLTTLDLSDLNQDIYLTTADFDYQYNKSTIQADFVRATGLVIVETDWTTFPNTINASEKTFTGLYSEVSKDLKYDKEQTIKINHTWTPTQSVTSYTMLPPSTKPGGTTLHMRYYNSDHPDDDIVLHDEAPLTIERNKITRVKCSFDLYSKSIVIETMVNGQWQQINGMHVD